jgi:hypothetical protein
MNVRENETRKKGLKFNGKEIVLAVKMMEALEKTTEVVCHLMEHEGTEAFVLILMTAENIDMLKLLEYEKRDTDVLFEIDKEEQIYAILCQDTKIDGGYRFAERVIQDILKQEGKNVYCSEVEVRSTRNQVKDVVFKLLEIFVKMQLEKKINQIVYKSLN